MYNPSAPAQQPVTGEEPVGFDPMGLQGVLPEPHRGDLCPNCGQGFLEYDGMLNLGCEICGFSLVGCFT